MKDHGKEGHGTGGHAARMGWKPLALMAALSFASMYALMYVMVDVLGNVLANANQFYMAAAMTAAMVLIEAAVMHPMYGKKTALAAAAAGAVGLVVFVAAVRTQFAVGDEEFLKSMIPHHGAAVLMCGEADVRDPGIRELCRGIVESQQAEIDWMQAKLRTLE